MAEHLAPAPGAILQFRGGTGLLKEVEGHRWLLEEIRWDDQPPIRMYDMTLVGNPRFRLSLCQEWMDRYGRLLVRGPGEEQAG